MRLGQAASGRVALQPRRLLLSAFPLIDPVTGAIGRRPSGARLYHRKSQFGPPACHKLDRNLRVRILYCAIAMDRRTRQKGQHGGLFKRTGIEVLRTLLFTFLNMQTGACFPSHEQIAEAAGCCVETVRKAIRALELTGIIETVRRKVVASFTSRAARVRFDVAVQTSNSYVFNIPIPDRPTEGDLELPLLQPKKEADARFRYETTPIKKVRKTAFKRMPEPDQDVADLEAAKRYWIARLRDESTTS